MRFPGVWFLLLVCILLSLHVFNSKTEVNQVEEVWIIRVGKQVSSLHIVVSVTLAVNVLQAVEHLDCNVGNGGNGKSILAPLKVLSKSAPSLSITMNLSFCS